MRAPFRSTLRPLHEADLRLFRRIAGKDHGSAAGRFLPRLSRAADHGLLWWAVSALLWAVGGRFGRRAAVRGALALGTSSVVVNGPLKWLARRTRPVIDDVPELRRLRRLPVTTSFPSGHSASAFAFASGAAIEHPIVGVPLLGLASAVAYSRVYTGVHYPGDVLAGALLGVGAAMGSVSLWPRVPHDTPAAQRAFARDERPPSPRGEGLELVVNAQAGSNGNGSVDTLREALPDAVIHELDPDSDDLRPLLETAGGRADAVGIAGGDGSVNLAAGIALKVERPLLVVPFGTLNHLARDIAVDNEQDAIDALKAGQMVAIDVGVAGERIFLNTFSLGNYVELVTAREKIEDKVGKWPAVALALIKVLRHSEPIELEIDGVPSKVWMLFAGNCRYHPSGFAPSWRSRLDDGTLDVRIIDAGPPLARVRLILSILTGRLGRSHVYRQFQTEHLDLKGLDGPLRISCDGEVFDAPTHLQLTKQRSQLRVFSPWKD